MKYSQVHAAILYVLFILSRQFKSMAYSNTHTLCRIQYLAWAAWRLAR